MSKDVWYVNAIRRIVSLDVEYTRSYHRLGCPSRIHDIPELISLYRAANEIIELLWDSGYTVMRARGNEVFLYPRAPVCVLLPWIARAIPRVRDGVDCVDVVFNKE